MLFLVTAWSVIPPCRPRSNDVVGVNLALARALALAGLALAGGGLLALASLSTLARLARAGRAGASLLAGAVGAGLGARAVSRAGHFYGCGGVCVGEYERVQVRVLYIEIRDYRYA